MLKRLLTIGILVYCACATAQVQYTDAMLFNAYLRNDMTLWDQYLHVVDFNQASLAEKERYLSYEYGYVATAIDENADDALAHLQHFEEHINALTGILPEATILNYRSSLAAYKALMNKLLFIAKGLESFNLVKQAYEVDSLNPKVLALKGNVDFYAPKTFGGDKQRALGYFRTSQQLYEQQGDTINNWNYLSCRLCIIQCEDKIGNKAYALQEGELLLKRYPTFVYLRDTYLPDLRKRNKRK